MIKNILLLFLLVLILAGCTNQTNFVNGSSDEIISNKNDLTDYEIMMVLHCMEMEMMDCEKYKDISLTESQIQESCEMMSSMKICSNEKINLSKNEVLNDVQESQILNLKNGEKINLSIDIIQKEIAGQKIRMFGYNGQIPGPLLHVEQDSVIYVNVTNNLDTDTTVHWHGLRLQNKFDGVPGSTMSTQLPGESFEYKLDFVDEGIYWYHPHVREDYQQELGLYGNMLVDSKYDDYYNSVNLEVPLILDDILIENEEIAPFFDGKITHSLMGRFGNVMLTNGDDDYNLSIKKGSVVRFYITNVANTRMFNFSISGAQLKLMGGDIGSYEKEEYINSILIAPAERYIIEAFFKNEGEFNMKNINPHTEYNLGKILVEGEVENDYSSEFFSLRENNYVKEDINNFKIFFEKDIDVQINLSVEISDDEMGEMLEGLTEKQINEHCKMMPNMVECQKYNLEKEHDEVHLKSIEWEDEMPHMNKQSTNETTKWILKDENGRENMEIDLNFNIGDKVKIKLFNDPNSDHPMQHPIHFHGQRFLVLEKDGEKSKNLVWKDTVLVPVGSSVDILLDVTNPGEWMAHCHIAEHLQSGMMMSFKVSN